MAGGPGGPRKMPEMTALAPPVRAATIETEPPAATSTCSGPRRAWANEFDSVRLTGPEPVSTVIV